jgi:hypothetical protein
LLLYLGHLVIDILHFYLLQTFLFRFYLVHKTAKLSLFLTHFLKASSDLLVQDFLLLKVVLNRHLGLKASIWRRQSEGLFIVDNDVLGVEPFQELLLDGAFLKFSQV